MDKNCGPKSKMMKKVEKSTVDKKIDKITGYKEGSKKDKAIDNALMKAMKPKKK